MKHLGFDRTISWFAVPHPGILARKLDEALTAGLRSLGRRHGITLFMTVLAGWAAVLSRAAAR